jgi:hypothetical protein
VLSFRIRSCDLDCSGVGSLWVLTLSSDCSSSVASTMSRRAPSARYSGGRLSRNLTILSRRRTPRARPWCQGTRLGRRPTGSRARIRTPTGTRAQVAGTPRIGAIPLRTTAQPPPLRQRHRFAPMPPASISNLPEIQEQKKK